MYDIVIVGGGPAGMTAAVYAARKKLNTVLVSTDLGGQTVWATGVENYMGYQFIQGVELMQKFEEQVKHFPIEIKTGEVVTSISRKAGSFEVVTERGSSYQGRAVIVATGKRPRSLNVQGEGRLRGRGVSYCATCDGPLFAGQKVAVIGGGNSALEAAADMMKIAEHVYLVSNAQLTGDAVLVDRVRSAVNVTIFLEHEVVEIKGDSLVSGLVIRGIKQGQMRELAVSGVFVEIGLIPNSDPVKGLVRLNELGEIEVDCTDETDVPGLFAAGDVTSVPEKQIVIAAGEGAKAMLRAHRYLGRLADPAS